MPIASQPTAHLNVQPTVRPVAALRAALAAVTTALFVLATPSFAAAHEGHGDHTHEGPAAALESSWHPVSLVEWVAVGAAVTVGVAVLAAVITTLRRRRADTTAVQG